jgi:ADP-ribose pyrophosphatase YjhB (NUDIX family)
LIFRRDAILIVERGREPLKGWWSLPGGLVETGERLEDAVRREVLEETGLEIRPIRVAEVFERVLRDGRGRVEYHYVLIDYLCKIVGGTLCPADDVSRAAWATRQTLGSYQITEGTQAVIERVWKRRKFSNSKH